jgi:CO/xanthine dehydrogenase FAD-binding subunit
MMKLGLATPDHLVDLPGIGDLKGIRAAPMTLSADRLSRGLQPDH